MHECSVMSLEGLACIRTERPSPSYTEAMKLASLVLVALGLSAMTACDPGYEFRVKNPCDSAILVSFLDSDEFDLSDAENSRFPTKLPPHSDTTWTMGDSVIISPFGVLLVNGPRAGEIIQAPTPNVTIPRSACAK